jgi:hypothetical protein
VIRAALYANVPTRPHPGDTLATIAAVLAREQARDKPRVRRVVSFNVDDLLERETNPRRRALSAPVLWPVVRESSRPRIERGAGGRPPLHVFHVHGFLPRDTSALRYLDAPVSLVFTDAQYWASFAEPTSFPNRVMVNALYDSTCVFVGLSMTDLNLSRWLGMRANAIVRDRDGEDPRAALEQHVWIRPRAKPGSAEAMLTPLLDARGVRAMEIREWGELGGALERLGLGVRAARG